MIMQLMNEPLDDELLLMDEPPTPYFPGCGFYPEYFVESFLGDDLGSFASLEDAKEAVRYHITEDSPVENDGVYIYGEAIIHPLTQEWVMQELKACMTLDELLEALREMPVEKYELVDVVSLPTWGKEPDDTSEIWSWDETRLMVSDDHKRFVLEQRSLE